MGVGNLYRAIRCLDQNTQGRFKSSRERKVYQICYEDGPDSSFDMCSSS